MKIINFVIICILKINPNLSEIDKIELCRTLDCDEMIDQPVCGMRRENGRNVYKLFDNECLLLKYGCQVDDDAAYGIIYKQQCYEHTSQENDKNHCPKCQINQKEPICGIRKDDDGFIVRIFENKCQLKKYNCEQDLEFYTTDLFICNFQNNSHIVKEDDLEPGTDVLQDIKGDANEKDDFNSSLAQETDILVKETTELVDERILALKNETDDKVIKKIVVIDASSSDLLKINNTVEDFFAATHVFDLPIREVHPNVSENTRRRLIKIFGPIKVFRPSVIKPENVSEDYDYEPTLASCFHKCPKECPQTYAPVCGFPGLIAREPSLMFQNHCFMDVAQCKMYWEDKSETAKSSAYVEASFFFCLGDDLNGLYRFLPLIRTLQRMGRLKKKGRYKYKLKNMRFFNKHLGGHMKVMG